MPHLVLIDGPNYVYRAFHAIRHLSNSKGEPTNAVFGYVQMLKNVLGRVAPTHVAVAFDPRGGTFRNQMYPEYKAHRPPMPEELADQWPKILEITKAFNLPMICIENYEADDVIATLAMQAEKQGWDVTVVSTDKDLMQLVNDRIHLLDTMKDIEYDPAAVKEKWGVEPARIHDLLALAGDSADNIPGVPGIGPKTAVQLLDEYGALEDVLNRAGEIKQNKRRENLIKFADDARLSYKLVALDHKTPVDCELNDLTLQAPDRKELTALFTKLEFKRLIEEYSDKTGHDTTPPEQTRRSESIHSQTKEHIPCINHLVDDKDSFELLLSTLNKAELVAVDTETTSLNTHDAEIVGVSFSVQPGEGWYLPIGHRAAGLLDSAPQQLDRDDTLKSLQPFLEDPGIPKCGHNLKYDMQVFRRAGIKLSGITADSMLLAYCLYPAKYPPKMDRVAEDYLDHRCITYEEVAGKGAKQINFAHVPIKAALAYAGEDAEVALRLTQLLKQKLKSEQRLERHDDIELPLSFVLSDMEWTGTKIDKSILSELSGKFGTRIEQLELQIHDMAGYEFNIHSPKQLGELLFDTLKIPGGKKTKSGQWATGQEMLEKLAQEHEVPRLVLKVRQLSKLKSTYTDALQKLIHPETGRVHTSYNQAITSTGRLSSSDPNLQNIPIRTEEGRMIRKAFIAEEGNILLSADYSQIELRLMAHFSEDEALIQAFAEGQDIHASTAAAVNDVALENVTGEMRRHAKIINFGILYGMSAFGLSKQLGLGRSESQAFIDAYFDRYPSVRQFMDQTLEDARSQGYIETLLGHRVYLPDINAKNGMHRAYAERTAINAPLQGSAADIIKVAMIRLHEKLKQKLPDAHMTLQVHDELVVECPEHQAEEADHMIREIMETAAELRVPLSVDIGRGKNWFDAHQL